MSSSTDLTEVLIAIRSGEDGAQDRLYSTVYEELRRMAHARMASERRRNRSFQTLQTTALAHEAYLRLVKDEHQEWENRRHFFGAAVRAMQRILVDKAREKDSKKRGERPVRVTLGDEIPDIEQNIDVLDLHEALERLDTERPEHADVVRYRFFLGLTVPETAELLGVSARTIDNRWQLAKAWLRREVRGGKDADGC